MTDIILSPGLIALGALISWISAIGLLLAAFKAEPHVFALTERAVIALLISVFLTVYALVAFNTDVGFTLFPFAEGSKMLRIAALGLSFIGPVWLAFYFTGRLGGK